MLKEIHEQPKAVRDTLAGKIALNKEISFDNIKFTKNELDNFDKIYIVACGTAYNAGLVGKHAIENLQIYLLKQILHQNLDIEIL